MNDTDRIRIIMRWIIAGWFLVINLLILIPSVCILVNPEGKNQSNARETVKPPAPPSQPALPQVDQTLSGEAQKEQVTRLTQQVSAYTQQVNAYTQQVSAYKLQLDVAAKTDHMAEYKSVVTDTLVPILTASIVTFLGWVFANIAAGTAERLTESKQRLTESLESPPRQPLKAIKLL